MENKQDLRVIKTRNNIKNSFIQLLCEKNFNTITIQDILNKALINRKTFYNHYQDKYDLVEQLIYEFFNEFKLFFELRTHQFTNIDSFLNLITTVYNELYEQRDLILGLWNVHTENIDFYVSFKNLLQQKYEDLILANDIKNLDIGFQSNLFSTFVMSTLKYMLDSNKTYTAHDIWNEFKTFYTTVMEVSIRLEESK